MRDIKNLAQLTEEQLEGALLLVRWYKKRKDQTLDVNLFLDDAEYALANLRKERSKLKNKKTR